jgi:GC-rich sequence DNA-binding factor
MFYVSKKSSQIEDIQKQEQPSKMDISEAEDKIQYEEDVVMNTEEVENMEMKEDEEDEELKRWEMEQMKKGGAGKHAMALDSTQQGSAKPQLNISLIPQNISVADVQKQLQDALKELQASLTRHKKEMEANNMEIEETMAALEKMQREKQQLGEEYVFFQEMRDFVFDLFKRKGEK